MKKLGMDGFHRAFYAEYECLFGSATIGASATRIPCSVCCKAGVIC